MLGAANDREAKARSHAEANFQTAREAVDRFFKKVSDDPRLKAHGLERLRQDLLRQAQSYYERFVTDPSTTPEVEAERGLTYLQLAKITAALGQTAEAIPLSKQARKIFEMLARDHPRHLGLSSRPRQGRSFAWQQLSREQSGDRSQEVVRECQCSLGRADPSEPDVSRVSV